MYVWIWRKLPGGIATKIAATLMLGAMVIAVLFFVLFPWLDPRLPWSHATVD